MAPTIAAIVVEPSTVPTKTVSEATPTTTKVDGLNQLSAPLPAPAKDSKLLSHPHHDSTPVIGTEFSSEFQVTDVLGSDSDIRDLASLISQRGVVFLRNQKISPAQLQELIQAIGTAGGKPASSGLHIHPLTVENGKDGDQISIISSEDRLKSNNARLASAASQIWNKNEGTDIASQGWHSDITFENVPSDYAVLKVNAQPATGGDTVWGSGYELYDRLSPAFQRFLETLSAVHNADTFIEISALRNIPLRNHRGAPENDDPSLTAIHPVIRTNPTSGFKSVFVNKGFTKRILGVNKDESDHLLNYLFKLQIENHDLQVRFRWSRNEDGEDSDIAIWDNRSTYHTATDDYIETGGLRLGDRAVSLGERPFLDAAGSTGRREALGLPSFQNVGY